MIQSVQIRAGIIDIARGHMGIGDQAMLAVYRVVIQMEEALRLLIPHHITCIGVSIADLGRLGFLSPGFSLERLLPVDLPVCVNRFIEFIQIRHGGDRHLVRTVAVLVGAGFEVSAVGVQGLTANQALLQSLRHNLVEDHLLDIRAFEAAPTVLAEGGGIGYPVPGEIEFQAAIGS
jgi:hypothetical protein